MTVKTKTALIIQDPDTERKLFIELTLPNPMTTNPTKILEAAQEFIKTEPDPDERAILACILDHIRGLGYE